MAGRYWIACGALLAAVGVAAGALGAHVLKGRLSGEQMTSFETAVRYQLFHAMALVVAGLLLERHSHGLIQTAAAGFLLGIVLFSGGLYGWLATGAKPLVHVVPVGGILWILAWLTLAIGAAWHGPLEP